MTRSVTSAEFELIVADGAPVSLARVRSAARAPMRVGLVQQQWFADPDEHVASLRRGVALAVDAGAEMVCLQEITLMPYCAIVPDGPEAVGLHPEPLPGGPTHTLATELATEHGVFIHASLWEADLALAPRGWNTAICVSPAGALIARTHKMHIPVTAGYFEDLYFERGITGYPVIDVATATTAAKFGFPTCWDEWFPELARIYSLQGAEVLVYPTAIGSEPDHPDFDTMPLWRHVIVGNGITSGTFMVVPNRIGTETLGGADITFYGSSFISDPYGRVLVEAPRDRPAVLVADLDLDQCRDWLDLFPFDTTRRPDTYGGLVE